jgi:hypothetical protein
MSGLYQQSTKLSGQEWPREFESHRLRQNFKRTQMCPFFLSKVIIAVTICIIF